MQVSARLFRTRATLHIVPDVMDDGRQAGPSRKIATFFRCYAAGRFARAGFTLE